MSKISFFILGFNFFECNFIKESNLFISPKTISKKANIISFFDYYKPGNTWIKLCKVGTHPSLLLILLMLHTYKRAISSIIDY